MAEPERARQAADRLAVALEEVGFDVGRAFPMLQPAAGRDFRPLVELGPVAADVAEQLSAVLTRAAEHGVTVPPGAPERSSDAR